MKTMTHHIFSIQEKPFIRFESWEQMGVELVMSTSSSFGAAASTKDKAQELSIIYSVLGIPKHKVFSGYQVHGNDIAKVNLPLPQNPSEPLYGYEYPQRDGLITPVKKICLLTKFADCTPIVIYDPIRHILCSLHSGWKGTSLKIAKKGIDLCLHSYQSKVEDLLVFIGPAIKGTDFEVQQDLIDIFTKSHVDISAYLKDGSNGKYLFDMPKLLQDDLKKLGIAENNIYTTPLSTLNNPMLHSYRRDKEQSGRMLLFAQMK